MFEENHKEFIKKKHLEYKKIGHIECPAFGNEKIYFNKYGFNHLIWKGKKMRNPEQQKKRIELIDDAVKILAESNTIQTYRKLERVSSSGSISIAHFWSFSSIVHGKKVTVVVRQTNNGTKHFMSVM